MKRWCGIHVRRARRHQRRFRAPARADRRSAFPCGRRHLGRWGSRADLHFHSNWPLSRAVCASGDTRVSLASGQRCESRPQATVQSDAQARERRPLVGTARRRRAAGKDPEWPRRHEKVVRHSRRQGSASSAQVSRSRACRPEVGVPLRPAPSGRLGFRRAAGKDPEWPRRHEKVVRHSRRQSSASSAQFSRSRACRPEVGVPLRPAPSGRLGFRRAAGKDPELPRRHEKVMRYSRRESSASSAQVLRSRACRAPPGELPRGRRSLACGQHCRSGGPHREYWRRSFATGVCGGGTLPIAQNTNGSELCSLPSISGESVKGGYPRSQSTMTNRNLPPRACGAQGSFDFRREAPGGPWTGPRRNRA